MPPIGVVLAQLGTPAAPTAAAVRPYLRQFLSDRRVVDYPPLLWQPLLRGVILLTRPARSARLYARIWTPAGSPLLRHSQAQADGLQARLGAGHQVALGMTYGEPSIRSAVAELERAGIDRVIILPMYPQFSSTTTASVYDAAYQAAAGRRCPWFHERKRRIPALRFVPPFFAEEGYLAALAGRIEAALTARARRPDCVLFSFHGIPQRYADEGDPYPGQCEHTARRLAAQLGLPADGWRIGYQSRFGPEPWLRPSTQDVLDELARAGQSALVAFPGFTADCLETLEELGHTGREGWAQAGGAAQDYGLVPCLNDDPAWLDFLADLVRRESGGW